MVWLWPWWQAGISQPEVHSAFQPVWFLSKVEIRLLSCNQYYCQRVEFESTLNFIKHYYSQQRANQIMMWIYLLDRALWLLADQVRHHVCPPGRCSGTLPVFRSGFRRRRPWPATDQELTSLWCWMDFLENKVWFVHRQSPVKLWGKNLLVNGGVQLKTVKLQLHGHMLPRVMSKGALSLTA